MTDDKKYGISKELADKIDREYDELFGSDNAKLGFKAMTDDNLDDVQPTKTAVQRTNEKEHNKIWNAAIEAAAKQLEVTDGTDKGIRSLKK